MQIRRMKYQAIKNQTILSFDSHQGDELGLVGFARQKTGVAMDSLDIVMGYSTYNDVCWGATLHGQVAFLMCRGEEGERG